MIAVACDHAALKLKNEVIKHLKENGYEVEDFGIHEEGAVDYPDYALPVAEAVASGKADKGILICGTGIGMSIAANKVKGIRCALCSDTFPPTPPASTTTPTFSLSAKEWWDRGLQWILWIRF